MSKGGAGSPAESRLLSSSPSLLSGCTIDAVGVVDDAEDDDDERLGDLALAERLDLLKSAGAGGG